MIINHNKTGRPCLVHLLSLVQYLAQVELFFLSPSSSLHSVFPHIIYTCARHGFTSQIPREWGIQRNCHSEKLRLQMFGS